MYPFIPIFIIGAGKSGTTTLYDLLVEHPEICACIKKEPEYFTNNRGGHDLKIKTFKDLFPSYNRVIHKYVIEASTGYSMAHVEPEVAIKMKNYGLRPFIIYIIRDPFKRMESHYNFNRSRSLKWKGRIDDDHLINTSKYYYQLQQYLSVFGKGRILLLELSELEKNPEAILNRVLKFIGASPFEWKQKSLVKKSNTAKVKSRLILRIETVLNKILPKQYVRKIEQWLNKLIGTKKKELTNAQRIIVKKKLNDDMFSLNNEYGVDIGKWGF